MADQVELIDNPISVKDEGPGGDDQVREINLKVISEALKNLNDNLILVRDKVTELETRIEALEP